MLTCAIFGLPGTITSQELGTAKATPTPDLLQPGWPQRTPLTDVRDEMRSFRLSMGSYWTR
ncbi:MAG: hypothetical protein AVDCRST_MAG93-849 [uncultured Chloroflexia bacterium]|uniref:Uncharacterized protein n=1 Tax=uncultured Chloroflexia bacterium TaxID=1672391 RepID=A0A6J4HS06_9CHLR|nr:MAG: hypothetical protein AVDCRST_MAG93-849 [uncultured Chloroflexia bacterium]